MGCPPLTRCCLEIDVYIFLVKDSTLKSKETSIDLLATLRTLAHGQFQVQHLSHHQILQPLGLDYEAAMTVIQP